MGWQATYQKAHPESPRGTGASCSMHSEFMHSVVVAIRVARIHHKQVADAVKGQTLGAAQHGTKSRPSLEGVRKSQRQAMRKHWKTW
jgi:hypothetical protein